MTPQQKMLVKSTWKEVETISEKAAELFYGRLFELDPKLKPLFKSDIGEQGKKLMQMLSVCVSGLDNLNELVPAVEALGRRHVGYEVKEEQYETVGAALLWTLEKGLGDQFTEEVKEAWAEVYLILSETMKKAAANVAA